MPKDSSQIDLLHDVLITDPLVRIINIQMNERRIVTLNWLWTLTHHTTLVGESCSPVVFEADVQAFGWITQLTVDTPVSSFPPDWVPNELPTNPTDMSFGMGEWAEAHIARTGIAAASGILLDGEGAGSATLTTFGTPLDGIVQCIGPVGSLGGTGTTGLHITSVPPPFTETGITTGLSWPQIKIRNTETDEVWDDFRWHVFGQFAQIQLTLTYDEEDQED